MGMKEVIEGTIADTVNERLQKVKEEISKELVDIYNRCLIRSKTDPDPNVRESSWTQMNAVESVRKVVIQKIDDAMVAHPSGKGPSPKGGMVP